MKHQIQKIDDLFWSWLQKHSFFAADYFCRDLSSLGGGTVIPLVIGFSSVVLFISGNAKQAVINICSSIVAIVIVTLLKEFFQRSPPIPPDPWHTGLRNIEAPHFPAFPSGHTCMSVFTYLILAIMAGQTFSSCNLFFVISALSLGLTIGLSKCYLGAHYLSDIVAGYGLGLLFVFLWWLC